MLLKFIKKISRFVWLGLFYMKLVYGTIYDVDTHTWLISLKADVVRRRPEWACHIGVDFVGQRRNGSSFFPVRQSASRPLWYFRYFKIRIQ